MQNHNNNLQKMNNIRHKLHTILDSTNNLRYLFIKKKTITDFSCCYNQLFKLFFFLSPLCAYPLVSSLFFSSRHFLLSSLPHVAICFLFFLCVSSHRLPLSSFHLLMLLRGVFSHSLFLSFVLHAIACSSPLLYACFLSIHTHPSLCMLPLFMHALPLSLALLLHIINGKEH